MKKFVATLAAGILIAGATVTTASAQEHEVQSGESLWKIANKYNTTVDELIKINHLKSTVIYPKQVIEIDGSEENGTESEGSYTVKTGDTLSKIGNQFGVTVAELKAWNNLNSDIIHVGDVLALHGEPVKEIASADETADVAEPAQAEQETQPVQEEAQAQEETAAAQQETAPVQEKTETEQKAEGKTISVTATAYTADCAGCSGITATGVNLKNDRNAKVIAVDPSVIPLGSKVYVEGYGYATAADTGGAIKGNKIDIHVPSTQEALNWGNRTVNVTIVD